MSILRIEQIDVVLAEDGRIVCYGHTADPDVTYGCSFSRTIAATPEGFDNGELDEMSERYYREMARCIFEIQQGLEA
jgi:hypothetical protein